MLWLQGPGECQLCRHHTSNVRTTGANGGTRCKAWRQVAPRELHSPRDRVASISKQGRPTSCTLDQADMDTYLLFLHGSKFHSSVAPQYTVSAWMSHIPWTCPSGLLLCREPAPIPL